MIGAVDLGAADLGVADLAREVATSRRAQGLGPLVTDAAVLAQVAAILATSTPLHAGNDESRPTQAGPSHNHEIATADDHAQRT